MWWCVGIKVLLVDQDEKLWQGLRCTYGWCWCQARKLWQVVVVTSSVLLFHGLVLLLVVGLVLLVGAVSWLCYALWRLLFG